jgi:hypothetical protein
MAKRISKRNARLILVGGAGVAAVTFHGVFLSGCGSVNPCYNRDGGPGCEPYDSGVDSSLITPDAKADGAMDAGDAARDGGDAASDAPTDAPSDSPDSG